MQAHVVSAIGTSSKAHSVQASASVRAIQASLPRAASQRLTPCPPRENVLPEEGNHPASVLTSENSDVCMCPSTAVPPANHKVTAAIFYTFCFFPLQQKNQWMYNFLFVHWYFYLSPKRRFPESHLTKKGQNWKGVASNGVSETIRGRFFTPLFHLWQWRSQAQKWSARHDGCFAVNDTLLEVSTQFSVNKWLYKNSHYLRRPFSFQDKRTSGWKLQN